MAAVGYKEVSRFSRDSAEPTRASRESDDGRASRESHDALLADSQTPASRWGEWRRLGTFVLCAFAAGSLWNPGLILVREFARTSGARPPNTPPAHDKPSVPSAPAAGGAHGNLTLPDVEGYWRQRHPLAEAHGPAKAALIADAHYQAGRRLFRACLAAPPAGIRPPPFVLYLIGDSTFRAQYASDTCPVSRHRLALVLCTMPPPSGFDLAPPLGTLQVHSTVFSTRSTSGNTCLQA